MGKSLLLVGMPALKLRARTSKWMVWSESDIILWGICLCSGALAVSFQVMYLLGPEDSAFPKIKIGNPPVTEIIQGNPSVSRNI